MYGQAVGFNPGASVLSGLNKKGPVGQFAAGQAMSSAANLNMNRDQANQKFGVEQMQEQSQQRQRDAQNRTTQANNAAEMRMRQGDLDSRSRVFDTSMDFDYAGLNRRRQLNLQQALLNDFARDF